MAKTDTQIGIRVTSELKARIEAQAQRERRPVSNLMIKVMEEYLAAAEPTADKDGPAKLPG